MYAFDSDEKSTDESVSFDGGWRRYPWAVPVAFELGVSGRAGFRQSWRRENAFDLRRDSASRWIERRAQSRYQREDVYGGSWSVGLGIGRVRDATGVFSARVLEKRLRDTGVIVRPLTPGAAAKLAALFYVEPDFMRVHDRPNKHFWRELERILREDGALGDAGLDGFSVLRAREPTSRARFYRPAGAFLGVVASGQHSHAFSRSETRIGQYWAVDTFPPVTAEAAYSGHGDSEANLVLVGPRAEFHRPLGLRWQLDAQAHVYSAIRNDRIDEGLDVGASATAAWAVADRWYWTAWVSQNRSYARPRSGQFRIAGDQWRVYYGARLGLFVEDRLLLEISALESQYADMERSFLGEEGTRFSRDGRIELGLTYRFAGGLDAPGLIPPQQLTPGSYGP